MTIEFWPAMTLLLSLCATYALHSSLLLGGAWLACRWIPTSSHGLREQLWKLAALGGVLTAPVQLAFFSGGTQLAWQLPVEPARSQQVVFEPSQQPRGTATVSLHRELHPVFPGSGPAVLPSPRPPERAVVSASQLAVWGAGWLAIGCILTGLLRMTWGQWRLHMQLSQHEEITAGRAWEALGTIQQQVGRQRPIRLLRGADRSEPIACGVFRWSIILPPDLWEGGDFTPAELHAVLAHEVAHLVRRDPVWKCSGWLLGMCFPFQPLNRVARREWERSSEFLCDSWALSHGADRFALARALTQVAGWKSGGCLPALALGTTGTAEISARVEQLVAGTLPREQWDARHRKTLCSMAASGVLALLICLVPGLRISAALSTDRSEGPGVSPRGIRTAPEEARKVSAARLRTRWEALAGELDALEAELAELEGLLPAVPPEQREPLLIEFHATEERMLELWERRQELRANWEDGEIILRP